MTVLYLITTDADAEISNISAKIAHYQRHKRQRSIPELEEQSKLLRDIAMTTVDANSNVNSVANSTSRVQRRLGRGANNGFTENPNFVSSSGTCFANSNQKTKTFRNSFISTLRWLYLTIMHPFLCMILTISREMLHDRDSMIASFILITTVVLLVGFGIFYLFS